MLVGCAAYDSVSNALIPQCRTEACAQRYGKTDPKEVKRTTTPPTAEDVGLFVLNVAIDATISSLLWDAGLPNQYGERAPDWWRDGWE